MYYYFGRWKKDGTWENIHNILSADTPGLIITVIVHSAGIRDRDGAELLFPGISDRSARLMILADGIRNGGIGVRIERYSGTVVETVSRPDPENYTKSLSKHIQM